MKTLTLHGNCFLCGRVRALPVCRDGYFICAACQAEIEQSLKDSDPVLCVVCNKLKSWLWGRFETPDQFVCKTCAPGETCGVCGENKACKYLVQTEDGFYLMCEDCNEAAKKRTI